MKLLSDRPLCCFPYAPTLVGITLPPLGMYNAVELFSVKQPPQIESPIVRDVIRKPTIYRARPQ